jgi:alkylation response protein AidB-like acyl-CoA dehydrogenase
MAAATSVQPGLGDLCDTLAARAAETARIGPWAAGNFLALGQAGTLAGFIDTECGGTGAGEPTLQATLAAIAERCLTTALALSQWAAACRIIAGADAAVRRRWLPSLARGERFTTVGISHLTTSRQHVGAAILTATRDATGWRLDGLCPWVTGADTVDSIVTGAATDRGQMFFVVDARAEGVVVEPPLDMLALSGSRTSIVRLHGARPADAIAPTAAGGPRTGGLTTSALALGAARACLTVLDREARARPDLAPVVGPLRAEADTLMETLLGAATLGIDAAKRDHVRAAATSLVVRASQAALTASKGAGFVVGHPVERLVREAMFFLVWSCPQTVSHAVLCELSTRETAASRRFSLGGPPPAGEDPGLRP